jgi:hypothetical protein
MKLPFSFLECGSLLPPCLREASFARKGASKLAHSKKAE